MTHTEESRREAYERIKPKTEARHDQIIKTLRLWGPLTSWGIHPHCVGSVNSIRARLSRLKDLGVVRSIGRVFSNKANMKITLWALSGTMTPPPKKPTWKDRASFLKRLAKHWRIQALSCRKDLRLKTVELKAAEARLRKVSDVAVNWGGE